MHDPAKAEDSSVATFLDQTDFPSNICQNSAFKLHWCVTLLFSYLPKRLCSEEMMNSTISQNYISQHSDLQWWISIFFMHGSHSHGKYCNVLISRSKKSHANFFSEDNYFIQVISTWHLDNLANTVYAYFWSQWMFLLHIQKNSDFFSHTCCLMLWISNAAN